MGFISDWNIEQRLFRLKFLMKNMCGEELTRELMSVLSVTLGVESHRLLVAMHDGASVNKAGMRIIAVMYPKVLDLQCISHTLDIVGNKFKVPTLNPFMTLYLMGFTFCTQCKD